MALCHLEIYRIDLINNMDLGPFEFIFPVSNETDLQVLETKLRKDINYKHILILRLMTFGGEQMVHSIRLIMSRLFDDAFLKNFAFDGRGYKTKKEFSELEISKVLFHAILDQPKYKNGYYEARRLFKAYLSQSSYRAQRQANNNDCLKPL